MQAKEADIKIANQVASAVGQLSSLATLPAVLTKALWRLFSPQKSAWAVAETIEADPALTAKLLSVATEQKIKFADEDISIHKILDKLPINIVRNAILAVAPAERQIIPVKEMLLHSIAVACCAKKIAEIISPQINPQLAYLAGLLHNIGNLALAEVMPKSFERIVEEAKSKKVCICDIQRKYLGTDYTILGKRLAQKWQLPEGVSLAVWLHRSNTEIISANMPEAKIASIVAAGDCIARLCGIGQSGSFDAPCSVETLARLLAIASERLEQIRNGLAEQVEQKCRILGLDQPRVSDNYRDIVRTTAMQLAEENARLAVENQKLQADSRCFDFIMDFLSTVSSTAAPAEAAKSFAVGWQRFYQTGKLCLYLAPLAGTQYLEAVVVEDQQKSKAVSLNTPAEVPAIPQEIATNFAILNAADYNDWLFEQLDIDFELSKTKIIPLLCGGRAIGAIVFEFHYPAPLVGGPAQSAQLAEKFETAASVGAAVLDMSIAGDKQQDFAERFARLLSKPQAGGAEPAQISTAAALAEMAAGAAHELNNPLSVISGRAQLLDDTETDPEKKRLLKQIKQNTDEIAGIINGLMNFAQPPKPNPIQVNIKHIIDEAGRLVTQKKNIEQLDIQIEIADGVKDIFADPAQIVLSIANIVSNAVESYESEVGPVKTVAGVDESGNFMKLVITDFGCGMDPETLQKATQPFFSVRPAGRKRGMGLAQAQRLIQLNGGRLEITSQPGSGTTATIYLPCK